jgi:hypothetical protein
MKASHAPTRYSSIVCVADMNVTSVLDKCLSDIGLPEVFIQSAKQMSLADHQGPLKLRVRTKLAENRALIYRMNVPLEYEEGVIRRIAEVTDLKIGGRGSIFARRVELQRGAPLIYDTEKLERLCGKTDEPMLEEHVLICCTIPRGNGDSLAQAVLELSVCVPVIFFGEGLGLRDKLGLLRITVPIEKEIIWFIVPKSDADLVEKTIIPRARLDVPGQGFLYKSSIYAPAVNLRIRQRKRIHAATMEQVIAALDEVQGSRDWRRHASKSEGSSIGKNKTINNRGLIFIGDEEEAETMRKTAMDNGARGATFYSVEMRSYSGHSAHHVMESHSRLICNIVIAKPMEEKLREPFAKTGLFESGKSCFLMTNDVEMPYVLRRAGGDDV